MIEEQRQLLTLGFAVLVFLFALLALDLRDYGTRLVPSLMTIGSMSHTTPAPMTRSAANQRPIGLSVALSMQSR
ncbi:MAG: hypothetical protein IVW56_03680 [Candidatus Binataceae bacterium]|nr:hypothetical protein [Candidatus Binataceae bacterium]